MEKHVFFVDFEYCAIEKDSIGMLHIYEVVELNIWDTMEGGFFNAPAPQLSIRPNKWINSMSDG
jgi:hypothetical protein